MASVFNPLGRKTSKKRRQLSLGWQDWETLCTQPAALRGLLDKGYKANDVLEQYIQGFQPGGAFAGHGPAARQHALSFLKRHGVELCRACASVDAVRKLYEVVSEQSARPLEDGPQAAGRMQMLALDVLTTLLIGLRVHESDPRLLKVHVQRLYRELDPRLPVALDRASSSASAASGAAGGGGGGSFSTPPPPPTRSASWGSKAATERLAASPELHKRVAASDCLRSIELVFPGMLLAGGGRLLDLSLTEAAIAAPAAGLQLAITVLSHGAARYLEQQAAAAAASAAHAPSSLSLSFAAGEPASEETSGRPSSSCTSALAASLQATTATDGYSSDGLEGGGSGRAGPRGGSPPPPPQLQQLPGAEGLGSKGTVPAEAAVAGRLGLDSSLPSSPMGVASHAGRCALSAASTSFASNGSLPAAGAGGMLPPLAEGGEGGSDGDREASAVEGAAASAVAAARAASAGSSAAGSAAASAGAVAVPLLSKPTAGLRHFYVPPYYQGPNALGLEGCQLVLDDAAKQRLQEAVPHFLRLLPRVVPEDLMQVAALLAPLLRVAACPPEALQPLLERHLRSNNLPLLQAVLALLDELPSLYQPWEDDLVTQMFRILVGRSASEQRMAVLSWLLRRHHQQRYCKEASLFEANWRAALPASHDDVLLLTLKVKALTACIASGIGDVWEMVEAVNAWDGFWSPAPSAQHLRAAGYMLRMLCFAECHPTLGASEHRLHAAVASVAVQMAATRPQYLPAVESLMQHCDPALRAALLAAFNVLLTVAAPPPASPSRAASQKKHLLLEEQSSVSSLAASSSERQVEPSEHSVEHSTVDERSVPSEHSLHSGSTSYSSEGGEGAGGDGEEGVEAGPAAEGEVAEGEAPEAAEPAASKKRGVLSKDMLEAAEAAAAAAPLQPPQQQQRRHRHRRPHRSRSGGLQGGLAARVQSAPAPSALAAAAQHPAAAAAAGGGGCAAADAVPVGSPAMPVSLARRSSPSPLDSHPMSDEGGAPRGASPPRDIPQPSRMLGHVRARLEQQLPESPRPEQPGTPTTSTSLSARLSSSLPAVFSRFLSQAQADAAAAVARPSAVPEGSGTGAAAAARRQRSSGRQRQDRELAYGQEQQASESSLSGIQDPLLRRALVRSASFSAIAAAAGWIKAQHWLMDGDNCLLGLAPQPPDSIGSWEAAEAWLTAPATWQGLSPLLLRHDAMLYRTLLLEIVQSPVLSPLGVLSFLEQYAKRYLGELPGDALPPAQVGSALLAICQATVMAHLFDPAAKPSEGGSSSGGGWSPEQVDIAAAVQNLLSVLSTAFPVAQTRHKAYAFHQHLAAAALASADQSAGAAVGSPGSGGSGQQLVRQLLSSYLAEAIAGSPAPPPGVASSSPP